MNTAKMREKARYYESIGEWHNAALCWRDAIALYPKSSGELAKRDLDNMEQHAKEAERAADITASEEFSMLFPAD